MATNDLDVFVNCPFDGTYKPMFDAIIYTIVRSGFRARCAMETDNAAQNRLEKICAIIGECRLGVHDISRTEVDGEPPLPRFNMPLELGLFLGARRYGGRTHKSKACIVFDREAYRFQKFLSDIAGQDIHAHDGNVSIMIRELAAWLRMQSRAPNVPGGLAIANEYNVFETLLPAICNLRRLDVTEVGFSDFNAIVSEYVAVQVLGPF